MGVRWQDWVDVLLGCGLVVSPWLAGFTLDSAATVNACGLGAGLVVFNLISVCRLVDVGQEIFNILLGVWLFLSPYSLGFSADKEPTTIAIIAGLMIVSLAVWQLHDAVKAGGK